MDQWKHVISKVVGPVAEKNSALNEFVQSPDKMGYEEEQFYSTTDCSCLICFEASEIDLLNNKVMKKWNLNKRTSLDQLATKNRM